MPATQQPPLFFDGTIEEHVRKVSLITRELLKGKSNNANEITLTVDSLTTKLTDPRYSMDTVVTLSPRSATAATALAAGVVWIESHRGEIIVHHDSQSNTDRKFGAVFVG